MTTDDLRALLDAAAKATPNPCPMAAWENFLDHASPDVVAALVRIALAAVDVAKCDNLMQAESRALIERFDDALDAAGLLTTAPQETQP